MERSICKCGRESFTKPEVQEIINRSGKKLGFYLCNRSGTFHLKRLHRKKNRESGMNKLIAEFRNGVLQGPGAEI